MILAHKYSSKYYMIVCYSLYLWVSPTNIALGFPPNFAAYQNGKHKHHVKKIRNLFNMTKIKRESVIFSKGGYVWQVTSNFNAIFTPRRVLVAFQGLATKPGRLYHPGKKTWRTVAEWNYHFSKEITLPPEYLIFILDQYIFKNSNQGI